VTDLIEREVSVEIEIDGEKAVRFDGLRVQFKVTKTLKKQPNTSDIIVTNLNGTHRAEVQRQRYFKVRLIAGYKGSSSQIFSGLCRSADNIHRTNEWETSIKCGDGERQFVYAKVSESFAPGTSTGDVIRKLAKISGLGLGNLETALQTQPVAGRPAVTRYENGFTAYGSAAIALEKVIRAAGFEWSIQDGALQLLRPGQTLVQRAIVLNRDSGLIGSPEHGTPEKKGGPRPLKARSLLQPGFRPGGKVQIKSGDIDGLFRISRVEHTGDSDGKNWFSDLEVFQA
jgi:hypothetical protein